jgi:hypothetical protein
MQNTGFLHNIWDRLEATSSLIPDPITGQIIAARFPSPEMAAEFAQCASDENLWSNPLKNCDIRLSGNVAHLIWHP